ncbi:glycosyltransferase [Winogradskyella flava]|uniref:Glycosyltransferase n=2 Tax=Winogradskyella flava TaxID=1884876 RepID=A0A842IQR2_9FLAO|nr:glycosyltransferase [Winogradskyella flava]MBC2844186.1 glycosyltransferase [Winogradskyella flava]
MKQVQHKKRILVAPLNWGLGHATRCIPIINALIAHHFEPIIASDGAALLLLKKEFPKLKALELPSYDISYSKKANSFKLKMIIDSPRIINTIHREKKFVDAMITSHKISGIISDNRFGVRHKEVPSIFLTHQLRVLSGNTTWLSSKLHQNIILKFNECWVPDYMGTSNLSGELGHVKGFESSIKYIGPLSRFEKKDMPMTYDLLVILSGPEPQRTLLEEHLIKELKSCKGKVCFIKGIVETEQQRTEFNNIAFYNFMTSTQLETAINESKLILSRSGYTSIMDYAKLEKKAFLIPTPGQFEQEYLARKFKSENIAPYCEQKKFRIEMLDEVKAYSGFKYSNSQTNYNNLFGPF